MGGPILRLLNTFCLIPGESSVIAFYYRLAKKWFKLSTQTKYNWRWTHSKKIGPSLNLSQLWHKKFKTRPKLTKAWEIIGTICILFLHGVLFQKLSITNAKSNSDLEDLDQSNSSWDLSLPRPGLKATLFLNQDMRALGLALETLHAISISSFSLTSILDPERWFKIWMLVGGTENICVVIQELGCNLDSSSGPEPELMHINICLQLTVRKAEALIGGFPLPGPTWHSYLASSPFVAFTTWSQG